MCLPTRPKQARVSIRKNRDALAIRGGALHDGVLLVRADRLEGLEKFLRRHGTRQ
jgi:hypothetical protein